MRLFYFHHNNKGSFAELPHEQILFYELTIVNSGNLEYVANGNSVSLKDKDILFLPKSAYRSRRALKDADYVSFNFYDDPEDSPISLPTVIRGGCTMEISLLTNACCKIYEMQNDAGCKQLQLILQCIIEQLAFNLQPRLYSPLVDNIKSYVEKHISEQITLGQIAKELHFSSVYCSARFKKEMGVSIISYALSSKIKRAQELIIEGYDFKYISDRLGFTEYNYFSRVFKKQTDYTPSQYKKLFYK